jgi:uncharacterized membrane protein
MTNGGAGLRFALGSTVDRLWLMEVDMGALIAGVVRQVAPLSLVGVVTATLFAACSLTPSLLPRTPAYQGLVSGLSLAIGYALGTGIQWLWTYLELPRRAGSRRVAMAAVALALGVALLFLWQASAWQNSVRRLMGLDDVSGIRPFTVAVIALLVFGALLGAGRMFRRTFRYLSRRLERFLPRRVSIVLGVLSAVALFWAATDRILITQGLRLADSVSQEVDAAIPPDLERPAEPARTGSAASLIDWRDLGRTGREFVTSGPTAQELTAFSGEESPAPIRVYVGLNAASTPEARADIALRELQRVGAFERAVVLLVTPTGTGWVDPAALVPVEYLHRGDIASVAMQYSYLPSMLALPTDGAYGAENARALFQAVYGHWTGLPRDRRPALYLYGVSLGALNSDRSYDVHDIIADPFHGVLWTGPPFRSDHWNSITRDRQSGSPAWRPRFRDGAVVRFMNQQGGLELGDTPWGPFRIAYLQYGSDPITFFSVDSIYREPAWLREPRAPDVSPALRWFPVVTTVQLMADMAVANTAPPGYGHTFSAAHYIDAWLALMEPRGWTAAEVVRLKTHLASPR